MENFLQKKKTFSSPSTHSHFSLPQIYFFLSHTIFRIYWNCCCVVVKKKELKEMEGKFCLIKKIEMENFRVLKIYSATHNKNTHEKSKSETTIFSPLFLLQHYSLSCFVKWSCWKLYIFSKKKREFYEAKIFLPHHIFFYSSFLLFQSLSLYFPISCMCFTLYFNS